MRSPAFTLFEVIAAIGILVVAVSMIARLQMRSLLRITRDHDSLEKIFLVRKELNTYCVQWPNVQRKRVVKLESPEMTITTMSNDIEKKSSLASFKDRLKMVRVEGTWKQDRSTRSVDMMMVQFKAPQPEKEKR